MMEACSPLVKALIDKGVTILNPSTVFIEDTVDPARISGSGTVIHPGCRIKGKSTLIMEGAKLGREGPVTVEDCQLGPKVELKGGYFRNSVFLQGSNVGSGAQVREACILEEEASCAHSVGLKHTILFPFVTLGSLINFCDCFMSGGTSRKDHSEVGSSYIHFNYTPNQDKATASLLGDVPRGVMLDQPPIFLGGQGGLVGPVVIGYGTVIAAGIIFREDLAEGGRIITGVRTIAGQRTFTPGLLLNVKGKVRNNLAYIANLISMKAWYSQVRTLFAGAGTLESVLLESAVANLDAALDERVSRLEGFIKKFPGSMNLHRSLEGMQDQSCMTGPQEELFRQWEQVAGHIQACRSCIGNDQVRESFLSAFHADVPDTSADYITAVKGLQDSTRKSGTAWLDGIVREVVLPVLEIIPSFK